MSERDFKGVWIPKQIWLDSELGWSEKLLLVEIESLDNEIGCHASNEYLGKFFGLSKDRISKMVSSLKNKGYLNYTVTYKPGTKQVDKRYIRVDKIRFNGISENAETYRRKQLEGIGENADRGIGENAEDNNTSFNNTINNTINNNSSLATLPKVVSKNVKYDESSPYYGMAKYLYEKMLTNNPKAKEPNYQVWADDFRKIIELDERDALDVKSIIDFSQNDSFWLSNILSPSKLRKQYDQLLIKMNQPKQQFNRGGYQQNEGFKRADDVDSFKERFGVDAPF